MAYRLIPFDLSGWESVELTGLIQRKGLTLQINYLLEYKQGFDLLWPKPVEAAERRDGLWQSTCLELFVGSISTSPYWELNLCPSGHWNWYRLESYRSELTAAELDIPPLRSQKQNLTDKIVHRQIEFSVKLPQELLDADSLQVGLSAVLQKRDGDISYWAKNHGGIDADFHCRDGWLLLS